MEIYDPDTYARELMSSFCKRDEVSYASSTEPIHTVKEEDKYDKKRLIKIKKIKLNNENMTMELKETINMMNSADYKERFKAEYFQTKIRYEKLRRMLVKYDAGKLEFTPSCPIELLREQAIIMEKYLYLLETRAVIENVGIYTNENKEKEK